MKPARMVVLVLQVLAVTYALVAAQHVHAAISTPANDLPRVGANGGGLVVLNTTRDIVNATLPKRNPGNPAYRFYGGRHNDTIPSLGANRRYVGLLLEARDEESDQLQGCITVAIAPRFFLTRASCVRYQQNQSFLFVEVVDSYGVVTRYPLPIKSTNVHPELAVNLAIVEVDDRKNVLKTNIQPMPLSAHAAPYYKRDETLSLISIDNIFNPSLATNAQAIHKLIRVPVQSCQYNSDPSSIHCFAPAELENRQETFEFGQGMLVHKSQHLVGLPDCEGLCSGGMFYSTTFLASHRDWIDETTAETTRWVAGETLARFILVPVEKQPTSVALYTAEAGSAAVCAGSLIAPRFVLTTASCARNHSLAIARMNHGERATAPAGHDDPITITTISLHPQFANTTILSNDLAVLELSGPSIYQPTILASDDALDQDEATDAAVTCHTPRRSHVDSSVMCLPAVRQQVTRKLGGKADLSLNVSGTATPTPGAACRPVTVEQWNKDAGDGVFDVPDSGSYYLLGLSTGLHDMSVKIRGNDTNHTGSAQARVCALDETVGDDDDATLVVRLATPETMEFIDATSMDHTWLDPHKLPSSILDGKTSRMEKAEASSTKTEAQPFVIAEFDGPLQFKQPAKNADLGFVVGLRFEKFGQNYCGGSLIAPSYVLTAAHCVSGDRAKFVSVGSHESKGTETEVIAVQSVNIITHPLYGKRSMYSYDVAILELDSQAYPKPIVLDNSRELSPSTYLTLYGYGANSASATSLSEVLRSVDLPYFARDKCKAKFPELDESMFCAGGELARDACTGDSGSPLVRLVEGKPRLVGVVSSGRNGCGTPGVPGVYALVAEVQGFIDSVVAGNKWVDPSKRLTKQRGVAGGAVGSAAGGTSSGSGTKAANGEEARAAEADGTVLRSSGNKTDLPFDVIHMANGGVDHQLSQVEMATDTPRGLQAALMEFLVGDYEKISGWRPNVDEHWKVAFFSTGDLTGLMKLIATHRTKPLYTRNNRFARPAWTGTQGESGAVSLSKAACASGP